MRAQVALSLAFILLFPSLAPATEYRAGKVKIEAYRRLRGRTTGRLYYGDKDGLIKLPHKKGGTLTFLFWNDQLPGFNSTTNRIQLKAGGQEKTFFQYTTSLEFMEVYDGFEEWGPAGGSKVTLQVPKGVDTVRWSGEGSQTGIELSDIEFSDDAPMFFYMEERVNFSQKVLISCDRTLNGLNSGRKYFGDRRIMMILPHNKGGILNLLFWNDQSKGHTKNTNYLNYILRGRSYTVEQATTPNDIVEFYKEFPKTWGAAGGMEVRITIPPGVTTLTLTGGESATGIEVSDPVFY